jgi:hypothetical protein
MKSKKIGMKNSNPQQKLKSFSKIIQKVTKHLLKKKSILSRNLIEYFSSQIFGQTVSLIG